MLLRRDPWLVSQTLMQMLYLLPPALLLWRSFDERQRRAQLLVPVLVMAAGQLAGGLAWLAISGEDAPDLVATAPIPPRFIAARQDRSRDRRHRRDLRAAGRRARLRLALACADHRAPASSSPPAAATAIQLWFRTQAKRSQFRRRQVSSRVATFAEAFSSIGWAATAAVAAVSLWLAIAPGLIAFADVCRRLVHEPAHAQLTCGGLVSTRRTLL